MFVFENPPGGAWGVRLACSLIYTQFSFYIYSYVGISIGDYWGKKGMILFVCLFVCVFFCFCSCSCFVNSMS